MQRSPFAGMTGEGRVSEGGKTDAWIAAQAAMTAES